MISLVTATGCAGSGHKAHAQAQALCVEQLRENPGLDASVLSAEPTTAGKAAAAFAAAGLPINDWQNLSSSTFVAECTYRMSDGFKTYWFVAKSGQSSLAPPSVSSGPTSRMAG
jgi:hypothetical protein